MRFRRRNKAGLFVPDSGQNISALLLREHAGSANAILAGTSNSHAVKLPEQKLFRSKLHPFIFGQRCTKENKWRCWSAWIRFSVRDLRYLCFGSKSAIPTDMVRRN